VKNGPVDPEIRESEVRSLKYKSRPNNSAAKQNSLHFLL